MRDLVVLFVHLVVTIARLTRPGGIRSVVAESILIKHQLQILNRNRKRAPYMPALPSICRAADRHDPEGISGPDAVLDNGGPGEEAARIPTLL